MHICISFNVISHFNSIMFLSVREIIVTSDATSQLVKSEYSYIRLTGSYCMRDRILLSLEEDFLKILVNCRIGNIKYKTNRLIVLYIHRGLINILYEKENIQPENDAFEGRMILSVDTIYFSLYHVIKSPSFIPGLFAIISISCFNPHVHTTDLTDQMLVSTVIVSFSYC